MAANGLRIVAVASFLPAFPLLLAHGIVSHSAVPATGLVPLAFSASVSLFILLRRKKQSSSESEEAEPQQEAEAEESSDGATQPVFVFAADVVLATALLIVLVFFWLKSAQFNGQQATLATYATLPLLLNFFIHLYFAVRSFSTGLALHDLTQYLAWQVVPADCPDCGHRLRPSSPPTIPWFESARRIKRPTFSGVKAPQWKVPAWLKRRNSEDAGLFVNDEQDRYRDDPEDGEPSTRVEEPAEVAVTGKKGKKAKDSPLPAGDENDEPRW
ncbi:hypothetical protein SCUP234_06444 [Seiridium cupressi]